MKHLFYLPLIAVFVLLSSFSRYSSSKLTREDEYKYVKEVNGVRIYYAIKAYSPKAGKAAKKIIFKLKNSTKTSKTVSFKATVVGDATDTKEISQCLKANQEHIKLEIPTQSKEIKEVKLEGEKATEGGC